MPLLWLAGPSAMQAAAVVAVATNLQLRRCAVALQLAVLALLLLGRFFQQLKLAIRPPPLQLRMATAMSMHMDMAMAMAMAMPILTLTSAAQQRGP